MKAEGENNMSQQLTNKQQARRTEVHVYVCMYIYTYVSRQHSTNNKHYSVFGTCSVEYNLGSI